DAAPKANRRDRKQNDTLTDSKNQKAAGHDVISCSKVFCGEHCCGHHKSRAVDRPQHRLDVLLRYHGTRQAQGTTKCKAYGSDNVDRTMHVSPSVKQNYAADNGRARDDQCRLWVKSAGLTLCQPFLVHPEQRTSSA